VEWADRARALVVRRLEPSISETEEYPTWSEPPQDRIEFFEHRFGGGSKEWIVGGNRSLQRDGSYGSTTAFWSKVRARAIELLGPGARPGIAWGSLTRSRCKSEESERGDRVFEADVAREA
jgi:hypothetical protein